MTEPRAIALKRPIKELVAEYDAAVADIRRAYGIIASAEARINKALGDTERYSHASIHVYEKHGSWDRPDEVLKDVRRQCWNTLVERMELRRYLSIGAWDKLHKAIQDGEMPEITQQSVNDVVQSFSSQLPALLTEAVTEVYNWLRPWRDHYKTNSKYEVGRKVVIEWMIDKYWVQHGKFRIEYRAEQKLTALENVFSSLDGQGQISKGYTSLLQQAVETAEDGKGETKYFRFKCYKNGNLHLEFLRTDLLLQFNKVAGASKLKGAA